MQFFGDDFLRVLLLRFIFCYVALKLHRGFKVSSMICNYYSVIQHCELLSSEQGPSFYPMSYPTMPKDELLENHVLQKMVLDLASILEVRALFQESVEID